MKVLLKTALDQQNRMVWDFIPQDVEAFIKLMGIAPPSVFHWIEPGRRLRLAGTAAVFVAARLRDACVAFTDEDDLARALIFSQDDFDEDDEDDFG